MTDADLLPAGWSDLAAEIRTCTACSELAASRTTVVVGVPPTRVPVLLVGEAPGAAEDETGLPFVGRAGALLDELLTEAGIAREAVGVANVLKCRPPGNRTPTRAEIGRCTGWLERQLALARPRIVVTLGGTAAAWAFGRAVRLADVRGRTHDTAAVRGASVFPTYHPSAALRFGPRGEPRRLLAEDLRAVARLLAEVSSMPARPSPS